MLKGMNNMSSVCPPPPIPYSLYSVMKVLEGLMISDNPHQQITLFIITPENIDYL